MDLLAIAPNWIIDLAPYYDIEVTEGGTFVFDFGDEIQVLIDFFQETEKLKGTDMEKVEAFLFAEDEDASIVNITETLYSQTHIGGKAVIFFQADQESKNAHWVLHGAKVKGGDHVLTRIFYPTEDFKDWAINTWRSITKLEEN